MRRRALALIDLFCVALLAGCGDFSDDFRHYCPRFDACPIITQEKDGVFACLFDGETGMYCAVPDASCASGYRWHMYSRHEIARQCVDPSLNQTDGGVADATAM
jgi:hypothetical protein